MNRYTLITADSMEVAITAESVKEAHTIADGMGVKVIGIYPTTTNDNGTFDADGIEQGARLVVRRTTANMIVREGGELHHRLWQECRKPNIDNPDVLDMLGVARLALIESIASGDDIGEQYHNAYLAINRHLRASRQINLSVTAQRTVYLEDVNGDIVSVNGTIGHILKDGERYTPVAEWDDNDRQAEYRDVITAITAMLTPTQKKVLAYMAKGYSNHQIANVMKRDRKTVIEHVHKIRKAANDLFPEFNK